LENVFPKNIAVQFIIQNESKEKSEIISNFDALVKKHSRLVLETEKFIKSREAVALNANDIDISVLKKVFT
jgi:hypothetical protein